jgi:flagellar protein FlaG
MSVTRVEGTRPLEATTNVATHKPRTGEPSVKHAGGKREAPAAPDEKPEPVSIFKPYSLTFRYEKELQRVVVKVIDPETGELLREIPPETVIEALKRLHREPGALVDEEV